MVCTEPQMFPHFDIKVVASVPFSLKEEMISVVVLQLHQVSSKTDKNKKVLIIDYLIEVLSVKVPLRSC